jgi:hypothetical protein
MVARCRVGVWCVLMLLFATSVVSALRDPFFDRLSGDWGQPGLEGEPDARPVWRIPGTIETLSFTPVVSVTAVIPPAESRPALPLLTRPPFVPPRG